MGDDLKARLEAARSRIASAEAARAERDAAEAEERAVTEAETRAADLEALEKFEREIGRVGKMISVVETDDGAVIVKRPDPVLFRRFQDSESVTVQESEKIVFPAVVYPSKEQFSRMLEETPGLLTRCMQHVCHLAGVRKEEFEKK